MIYAEAPIDAQIALPPMIVPPVANVGQPAPAPIAPVQVALPLAPVFVFFYLPKLKVRLSTYILFICAFSLNHLENQTTSNAMIATILKLLLYISESTLRN